MKFPQSPYFLPECIAWRVNLSGYLTKVKPLAMTHHNTRNLQGFESFLNLHIFLLRIKPNDRNFYICHWKMRWIHIGGIESRKLTPIFIYSTLLFSFPKNSWLPWKSPLRKKYLLTNIKCLKMIFSTYLSYGNPFPIVSVSFFGIWKQVRTVKIWRRKLFKQCNCMFSGHVKNFKTYWKHFKKNFNMVSFRFNIYHQLK